MKWTNDEELFLIHNYKNLSSKDLCQVLQRSWDTIRKKAHTLLIFKQTRKNLSLKDRLKLHYDINDKTGCWEWNGFIWPTGYGCFSYANKTYLAHRVSYELYKGKISDKLCLDHLCRNRKCINPDHLEEVTLQENIDRGLGGKKDICKLGHPLSGENLYIEPRGVRICRTCKRNRNRKYRENINII